MEKLVKNIDALEKSISGIHIDKNKKRDAALVIKDRISLCSVLCEGINSLPVRTHSEFAKSFQSVVELLFRLCDDSTGDIRLVAEESLNHIFRTQLSEGSVTRVHVELYRELKRNGPARCVRAALIRLALTVGVVRANKRRVFACSLVPVLCALLGRPEEAVHEVCNQRMPSIIQALGTAFNEYECKSLIGSALACLCSASSTARRACVSIMCAVCTACRLQQHFHAYLFKTLLAQLVPSRQSSKTNLHLHVTQQTQQLLGVLLALRQLLPAVLDLMRLPANDTAIYTRRHTATQTNVIRIAAKPPPKLTNKMFMQLLSCVLGHTQSADARVVSAALECLTALCTQPPPSLRLVFLQAHELANVMQVSPVGLSSRASSRGGSIADLSVLCDQSETLAEACNEMESLQKDECVYEQAPGTSQAVHPLADTDDTNIDGGGTESRDEEHDVHWTNAINDALASSLGVSSITVSEQPITEQISEGLLVEEQSTNQLSVAAHIGGCSYSLDPHTPPVLSSARCLCAQLLLTGVQGECKADIHVRVSHKCLAVKALTAMVLVCPNILHQQLNPDDESVNAQLLSDVLLLSGHDDPQLRAEVVCLAGAYMRAQTAALINDTTMVHNSDSTWHACEQCIVSMVCNSSAVCSRAAVQTLTQCLMFGHGQWPLTVLVHVLHLAANPYALLKVSVCELLANIPLVDLRLLEMKYWNTDCLFGRVQHVLLDVLLVDKDLKVRTAAACSLKRLCVHGCEPIKVREQLKSYCLYNTTDCIYNNIHSHTTQWTSIQAMHNTYYKQYNTTAHSTTSLLQYNISTLLHTLMDKLSGCVEGLYVLSEQYPPNEYPHVWNSDGRVLALVAVLLQQAQAHTLTVHVHTLQHILRLCAHLCASQALHTSAHLIASHGSAAANCGPPWPPWYLLAHTAQSIDTVRSLLQFLVRIICVYWQVLSEQVPVTAPSQPSTGPTTISQAASAITGAANRKTKEDSPPLSTTLNMNTTSTLSAAQKQKLGDFTACPALMSLYELLRGAYLNYKSNLEKEGEERFTGLLYSALDCLQSLLECASCSDTGSHADELLVYLRALMPLLPAQAVQTVTQLLKSLFGTNLCSAQVIPECASSTRMSTTNNDYTLSLLNGPSAKLAQAQISSAAVDKQSLIKGLGWFSCIASRKSVPASSGKQPAVSKATLSAYIRLFEPVVVQALRTYTVDERSEVRQQVLRLLVQLLLCKVNYSLLDTDHRFLRFMHSQLQLIEHNKQTGLSDLLSEVFILFVALSYERGLDGQTIMGGGALLQTANDLICSAPHNQLHTVLSIVPVLVSDLFCVRPCARVMPLPELRMQQEVLVQLLTKHLQHVQACESLCFVLSCLSTGLCEGEHEPEDSEASSTWRQCSRHVADTLWNRMAALNPQNTGVSPIEWAHVQCTIHLVACLHSAACRPADDLITALARSVYALNGVSSSSHGLGECLETICVCISAALQHCLEAPLLTRVTALLSEHTLEHVMGVTVQATVTDGVGVTVDHTHTYWPWGGTLTPEAAQFMAGLLSLSIYRMVQVLCANDLSDNTKSLTVASVQWLLATLTNANHQGVYQWTMGALGGYIAEWLPLIDWKVLCEQTHVNVLLDILRLICLLQTDSADCLTVIHEQLAMHKYSHIRGLCSLMHIHSLIRSVLQMKDSNQRHSTLALILSQAHLLTQQAQTLKEQLKHEECCDLFELFIDYFMVHAQKLNVGLAGFVVDCRVCVRVLCVLSELYIEDCVLALIASCTQTLCTSTHPVLAACTQLCALTAIHYVQRLNQNMYRIDQVSVYATLSPLLQLFTNRHKQRHHQLYNALCVCVAGHELSLDALPESEQALQQHPLHSQHDYAISDSQSIGDNDHVELHSLQGNRKHWAAFKYASAVKELIQAQACSHHAQARALLLMDTEYLHELLIDQAVTARVYCCCLLLCARHKCKSDTPGNLHMDMDCTSTQTQALHTALLTAILKRLQHHMNTHLLTQVDGVCECVEWLRCVAWLFSDAQHSGIVFSNAQIALFTKYILHTLQALTSLSIDGGNEMMVRVLVVCSCVRDVSCVQLFIDWLQADTTDRSLATSAQLQLIDSLYELFVQKLKSHELQLMQQSLAIPFDIPDYEDKDHTNAFIRMWRQAVSMLQWVSGAQALVHKDIPHGTNIIVHTVKALCRLPVCSSLVVGAPLSAFRFGWQPAARWVHGVLRLPAVPVHLLQNTTVLQEFVCNIAHIGWTSRQQFEEVWMALLGVLSATPVGPELTTMPGDLTERVQCSVQSVQCLSALLLMSLTQTTPGHPVLNSFVLRHRSQHAPILTTKFGARLDWMAGALVECERAQSVHRLSTVALVSGQLLGAGPVLCNTERVTVHNSQPSTTNTQFACGQLSVDTLWSTTGILAAERQLLANQQPAQISSGSEPVASYAPASTQSVSTEHSALPTVSGGVTRSASGYIRSTAASLDLVSCLHFLLDLFDHWLQDGLHLVPLPLLAQTVKAMVLLSDVFSERTQFVWLRDRLRVVLATSAHEDELILQWLILGLVKAHALLGQDNDHAVSASVRKEQETELCTLLTEGCAHAMMSVRYMSAHALLYALQADMDMLQSVLYVCMSHLWTSQTHLASVVSQTIELNNPANLLRPSNTENELSVWAVGFAVCNAQVQDTNIHDKFLPLFFQRIEQVLSSENVLDIRQVHSVLCGVRSLYIHNTSTAVAHRDARRRLGRVLTTAHSKALLPEHSFALLYTMATNLYAGLYSSGNVESTVSGVLSPDLSSNSLSASDSQQRLSAMEQLTHLFARVSGSGCGREASAVGVVLPQLLLEHFQPGDVINRVVLELLAANQTRHRTLLQSAHKLLGALRARETAVVVCDWVLLCVPRFLQCTNWKLANSLLTAFLAAACYNTHVNALLPVLIGRCERPFQSQIDNQLFVFVLAHFFDQYLLQNELQLCDVTQRECVVSSLRQAWAHNQLNVALNMAIAVITHAPSNINMNNLANTD